MRSVAKRLIFSHTTTAKRDYTSTGQPVCIPLGILNDKLTLEPNGAIVKYGDFRGHVSR
jgi:hypothetical protein